MQPVTFNYTPRGLADPINSVDTNAASALIGGRIRPVYENGEKMTPMKMKRIAAITTIALATIATIGFTIAAITVAWPFAIAAVVLAAAAIGGSIWALKSVDLNNSVERAKLTDKLAQMSFSRIRSTYSEETVMGYRLLDRIVAMQPSQDDATRSVYGFAHKLFDSAVVIERTAKTDQTEAMATYDRQCAPYKTQLDLHLAAVRAGEEAVQLAQASHPSGDSSAYRAAVDINNANTHGQKKYYRKEFDRQTAPFRELRKQSLQNINLAEEQALQQLNTAWERRKANVVGVAA